MEWTADLDAQAREMKANLSRLAPRELEALKLIGQGMRNKDIAALMNISLGTVRIYAKRIHDKLYVEGRSRLAVLSHHIFCRGVEDDRHPQSA